MCCSDECVCTCCSDTEMFLTRYPLQILDGNLAIYRWGFLECLIRSIHALESWTKHTPWWFSIKPAICEVMEVTPRLRLWKVKSILKQKETPITRQKADRVPVWTTERCIKLWKTVQGKIKARIRKRIEVLQWTTLLCRNFKDLVDTNHEPREWQNP